MDIGDIVGQGSHNLERLWSTFVHYFEAIGGILAAMTKGTDYRFTHGITRARLLASRYELELWRLGFQGLALCGVLSLSWASWVLR
ncbi:MAG: hypothetical protein ABI743_06620 [bacterium]